MRPSALLAVLGVAACAPMPRGDVVDVARVARFTLDLADPAALASVDGDWAWQPARFDAAGRAVAPREGAFQPLSPIDITQPRAGQRLSLAWYRVRFRVPAAAVGRPLALVVSADDYGEVVVDDGAHSGVARVAGFNGHIVARVAERGIDGGRHEVFILAVNAPLGSPPWRPFVPNEVFLRAPVLLVVANVADPTPPRPARERGRDLVPYAGCAVAVGAGIAPAVDALDADCRDRSPPERGPRWLRYDVDIRGNPAALDVGGAGYAEVWIDGQLALSPSLHARRVDVNPSRYRIDVLVWPAPFAKVDGAVDDDVVISLSW